jgi:hypothetical protein
MTLPRLLLPALAVATAAVLVVPTRDAEAYGLLGHKLNLGQRDFRIFNNFSDSSANNNTSPDPNFPGASGAVLAIWKGCVEWGSRLHGDGNGDPHQPGGLGSGGANFDPSYQGLATEVGGLTDNIHSELSGSSGGTLAFMEGGGNGWRIRYYSSWTWNDGPGTSFFGTDLQGVACHEYGHALGMAHSGSSSATMYPSISGSGVNQRSISSDDIAGIQAAYDPADAAKPIITGLTIASGKIQVHGSGFDAGGNEVWFTQASAGGDGIPIKVTDLPSDGTLVTADIPAAAGPGDVLVRRNGTGNKALSNAWPTDLQPTGGCLEPIRYCVTSPNSVGLGAEIGHAGGPSLAANDLVLTVVGAPAAKPGLFYYGPNRTAAIFGDGIRCVAGAIKRLPAQLTDSLGTASLALDVAAPPFTSGTGAAGVGITQHFQFWYRDPANGGAGFNTSDALTVTWCP